MIIQAKNIITHRLPLHKDKAARSRRRRRRHSKEHRTRTPPENGIHRAAHRPPRRLLAASHYRAAQALSGARKQVICSLRAPRKQSRRRLRVARAVEMGAPGSAGAPEEEEVEPSVDFAFVSPRLLPEGTPDVHYRTARGGQKLRDIMLEGYIDLYGPYDKFLLNCSGGGVCGTCIVEVVEGKEMLSPKTEVEKEMLKRKPKTWRLACQATVGNADSTGQMVIQQLPEWKIHEWDK